MTHDKDPVDPSPSAIILDPTFDAYYHSYYVQGLIDVFGASRVRYSSQPFPRLPSGCLHLIVRSGESERRVVIDAYDGAVVANYNAAGLEWWRYNRMLWIG